MKPLCIVLAFFLHFWDICVVCDALEHTRLSFWCFNPGFSRAPKARHIIAVRSDVNFGGLRPPRGGPWVLPRTPILRFKTRVAGSWLGIARTEPRGIPRTEK